MIGISKRIIAFDSNGEYIVLFNAEIFKKSQPYDTEEVRRGAVQRLSAV